MTTAGALRVAILALATVISLTMLVGAPAPSASANPITITAVGDSYLAGIGAGSYTLTDGCRRSSNSPPAHLARRLNAHLVDLTCPGGTITSASRAVTGLDRNSDLVVVQIGGNDMGFTALAGACLIGSTDICQSTVADAHRRLPGIRSGLLSLVRQIRLSAPTAEVLVLGYPRLLGTARRCEHLLDAPRVRAIDRLQRTLDRVIRSASRTAGAQFTDWPRTVDRASLCSADPWYALPGDRIDDLLHPDSRATLAMGRHLTREWTR